jgi:hypothetical protein
MLQTPAPKGFVFINLRGQTFHKVLGAPTLEMLDRRRTAVSCREMTSKRLGGLRLP